MDRRGSIGTILGVFGIIILIITIAVIKSIWIVLSNDICGDETIEKEKAQYFVDVFDENNSLYWDISLEDEKDIEDFIGVMNYPYGFNDFLPSSSNKDINKNIDNYKLGYVINSFLDDEGGTYYFKTNFLNREIEKVFSTGIDFKNGYAAAFSFFAPSFDIVCNSEVCAVSYMLGGGTGYSSFESKVVDSKKSGENTIYIVKGYYVDLVYTDDEGIETCNVLNDVEGKILIKNFCPDTYEELIKKVNPNKLNTYEFTFDSKNRFVSIKKIS